MNTKEENTLEVNEIMSSFKKSLVVLTVIAVIILGYLYLTSTKAMDEPKIEIKDKIVYKDKIIIKEILPKDSIVSIGMSDLKNDLKKNYSFLSTSIRTRILTSIDKCSKKNDISPIVIYGLISVESSFRAWIKSPLRTVTAYNGKRVKDQAIGLGSIMYSIWGAKLKKANLLETKTDLYIIENNIASIGYIFAELKKMSLKKGTYDKTTSAMRRYFGGNYKNYSLKIKDKIGSIMFSKVL